MNTELNLTLEILEGLAHKAIILNKSGKHDSDLQKEMTGVKYNSGHGTYRDPEDTIPN